MTRLRTIAELIRGLKTKRVQGSLDRRIKGIAYDSRNVKDSFIFVAIRGFSVDGHTYVKKAVSKGAVGVVTEKILDLKNDVTLVAVEDSRSALASIANVFYKEPSTELSLIGITGTNGKTTTSYITKSILEAWGKKTGLLGTIKYMVGGKVLNAANTTPESLDLQRYLRKMADNGTDYAVLEVSSHAIELKRVEGCSFSIAVFTNFSQDHLDFHGSMKKYFNAKKKLFDNLGKDSYAVLNWDDPLVRGLADTRNYNVITCGFESGAMLRAVNLAEHRTHIANHRLQQVGLSFDIETPESRFTVSSGLSGRTNVYNILTAAGVAYALGIDNGTIVKGIENTGVVDGRFETIEEGQDFLCIVDYAHTEDALRKLIQEARRLTSGRVITVFGCGGDRDRTKRPVMGAVSSELSDFTIITSDNPRTENPGKIIRCITDGMSGNNYAVYPDRADAIKEAVKRSRPGDILLIAGKGHEKYQEINGVKYTFSDKKVVRGAIQRLKIKN